MRIKKVKKTGGCNPLVAEPLEAAGIGRIACIECGLCGVSAASVVGILAGEEPGWRPTTPFMRPFVPKGFSLSTKRLVVVGEAGGHHEDSITHRPFTGVAGGILLDLLREAGYDDGDVAFVNAVRCRPENNATPSMRSVRACRPFLLQVLSRIGARSIVGVGDTALRALTNDGSRTNITNERGRLLDVPGLRESVVGGGTGPVELPRVWATYHPAATLYPGGHHLRDLILEDLKRQWDFRPRPESGLPGESATVVALDTEYGKTGDLLTVGLSDGVTATSIEVALEPQWKTIVQSVLNRASFLTGHSTSGDVDQMVMNGMSLPSGWISGETLLDSLLLLRMENENRLSYALENSTLSRFPVEPWKSPSDTILSSTGDMSSVPSSVRAERCRLDAWASFLLTQAVSPKVSRRLYQFTQEIACTIHRVEMTGAVVDLDEFESQGVSIEATTADLEIQLGEAARAAGMSTFSATNDNHIRELLYERLKLRPGKFTKKAALVSVDREALQALVDGAHAATSRVPELLLEHSRWDKLRSTYVRGLRGYLRPLTDPGGARLGWLPWHINPLGTRTGRRSSENPNSQNWPGSAKRIVRSRWVGGSLVIEDYARLEPVLLGLIAGDDRFLQAFTTGRGYIDVAAWLFGKVVEEGSSEYKAAKAIVLGTNYNMQAPKLSRELSAKLGVKVSITEAGALRANYLRVFDGVRRYMDARTAELSDTQQVVSATGRIRHLPHRGYGTPGWEHLVNQAINFPIQSLASDVTGAALVDLEGALLAEARVDLANHHKALATAYWGLTNGGGYEIMSAMGEYPLISNEVHDEIVVDTPPGQEDRTVEIVRDSCQSVRRLKKILPGLPFFNVKVEVRPRWGV